MDERLQKIDEAISANDAAIRRINKTASESRRSMSNADRLRTHDLKMATNSLRRARYLIIQTLTNDYEV